MKRNIILVGKIFVSSILLIYLFAKIDIASILTAMQSAKLHMLLFPFFLIAVGFIISALRWQILLKAQNISISLWKLARYYLEGSFFNNFLPTTIGGDIVRTYKVSKSSVPITQSFTIIVVERLTGIFALIVYAFLGLQLGYSEFGNMQLVWVAGGVFLVVVTILVSLVMLQGGKMMENTRADQLSRIKRVIYNIFHTLYFFKDKKKVLFKALFLAFVLQFNVIIFFYIISYSLDIRPPFYYFLIVIPLIHVILMFPVSINGIGIRENAFIFFLSKIGICAATSVALSWLGFAMVLIYAVFGGISYALK
jgi:uncharacterized protein (TIRG00374 family)